MTYNKSQHLDVEHSHVYFDAKTNLQIINHLCMNINKITSTYVPGRPEN